MSDQIDLSGETEPEEQLTEKDRKVREKVENAVQDDREGEYEGTVETEIGDLEDALDAVGGD